MISISPFNFIDGMSLVANKRYRYSSRLIDLSVVPTNIFNLKGDVFYTLVQELTSEDIEQLLRIQRISSARSFLNTNPLAFFDLKSDDPLVIEIQNRLSYKGTDNKNIILAGIDGDILYLKQLFELFLLKDEKKKIYPMNSTTTGGQLPPPIAATTTTAMSASIDRSRTNQLSVIEHRKYLTHQIKIWWEKHRNDYDLNDEAFTEPDDYELIINDSSAMIKCSCNQKINLPLLNERKHYQLSNFYKHLTRNDQCTAIRRKCVTSETDEDNDDDSETSFPSPVPSSSQHSIQRTTITKNSQQLKRSSDSSSNSVSKAKRRRRKL